MIFAIVLLVVGTALAIIGFTLMRPKSGDIPVGGGGYVNAGPEERPQAVREAGRIMLGIGLIMVTGGIVWILSRILMALAGIAMVVFGIIVVAAVIFGVAHFLGFRR